MILPKIIKATYTYPSFYKDGVRVQAKACVVAEPAQLIADGKLEIPIAAAYSLNQVRDAFREL